jgi:16S rRNA (cytidine1402-2'-O)-methyltransferase
MQTNTTNIDQVGAPRLYLLPVPLAEDGLAHIPVKVGELLGGLRFVVAERAKTARHWIKLLCPSVVIQDVQILELNKHGESNELPAFLQKAYKEGSVGVLSEAGCPGIADPGAEIVKLARQNGWQIVPISGPSSIMLALMASGMNGQKFTFQGYLPAQKQELRQQLRKLESQSSKENMTMIFIETPYRNEGLIEACLDTLKPQTLLCIASNISSSQEWIETKSIHEWKSKELPSLHKVPCIFLLLG